MFHQFLLLAERSPLRDMGSGFRDRREHFDPLQLLPWLVVLAVVAAALVVVSRYLNGKDNRRLYNNPQALFRSLCQAHELSRADQRLLWQLARHLELEQPAELFLDPQRFCAAIVEPEFRRHQEVLDALAEKLFASDDLLLIGLQPRTAAPDPPQATPGADESGENPAGREAMLDDAAEDDEASTVRLSEQHAVRALEVLMKQIQASRDAQPQPAILTQPTPVETPLSPV